MFFTESELRERADALKAIAALKQQQKELEDMHTRTFDLFGWAMVALAVALVAWGMRMPDPNPKAADFCYQTCETTVKWRTPPPPPPVKPREFRA